MGLSVRDWMVIVGVLLVVAVLLDGYRRMRHEWRSQLRMSLSRSGGDKESVDWELVSSELPNGGARVVSRREARRIEPRLDPRSPAAASMPSHEAEELHGEELHAPPSGVSSADSHGAAEPSRQTPTPLSDSTPEAVIEAVPAWAVSTSQDDISSPLHGNPVAQEAAPAATPFAEAPGHISHSAEALPSGADFGADMKGARTHSEPEKPAGPMVASAVDESPRLGPADEVLVINVLARNEPFAGAALWKILMSCDLRFGNLNIFHRYEQAGGKGPLQFSVANIVEPGVFDLDRIEDFHTQGVCFFMTLPGPEKPLEAFNAMVETAQCVVRNLNGELRDEAHSAMTVQTLEHCRARIREFERRQLTRQSH